MSNPDDGWAYSKVELTAIWDIPVKTIDILDGRTRRYEFFDFVSDVESRDRLFRATYWDLNDAVLEREGDKTEQAAEEERADTFLSFFKEENRKRARRTGTPLIRGDDRL